MPSPFPRSARFLAGESVIGSALLFLVTVLLLGAWGVWFVRATVPIYAASESARLEVLRATHPVDTPASGRVVAVHLTLEGTVAAGDVLVELDATAERLQLAEVRAKASGTALQLEATRQQTLAEERALTAFREQLGATLLEAQSRLHEGEIVTRAGAVEVDRVQRLYAVDAVPDSDLSLARAEVERRTASEAALRATAERLRRESATGERDRAAQVASLQRDVARLEGELASLTATIESLEHNIEARTIRAPASGRLGEIGAVRVGTVLERGERIATVVAGGDLRVVASFVPAEALGRVHAGQRARIRLEGFPWTEYGVVHATVSEVATELRDGLVRVELAVDPRSPGRIPLQHGLPGVVEVTVEEVSPATLVLRAVGRRERTTERTATAQRAP